MIVWNCKDLKLFRDWSGWILEVHCMSVCLAPELGFFFTCEDLLQFLFEYRDDSYASGGPKKNIPM